MNNIEYFQHIDSHDHKENVRQQKSFYNMIDELIEDLNPEFEDFQAKKQDRKPSKIEFDHESSSSKLITNNESTMSTTANTNIAD